MGNYHLQFDDRDVKSGLLNVDADGCLKGVAPERVFFTEILDDDGTVLCCGRPAKEMTQKEAYKLLQDAYRANALYVGDNRVLSLMNAEWGIAAAYCNIYFVSGPTVNIQLMALDKSKFKTEDA